MKAWLIEQTGGIDALRWVDLPQPVPGPGELLVQVGAAALNFSDLLMLRGQYQVRPPLPFTPGQEMAGRVVARGAGCSRVQIGERIASKVEWGGFAEYVRVRESMAIRLPEPAGTDGTDGACGADGACGSAALDDAAAATLPVVWPTAWIALHERALLQPGETVLVHAAAGGVGLACLQLVRAAGARSIALVGSRSKVDACRDSGADIVLCHDDPWVDLVRDEGGADVVVDSVGGDATARSLRCLARGGRLLLVGFSSGEIPQIPANRLLLKNASALGVYWSHDWGLAQVQRATDALLALQTAGTIRVAAGRRHRFDQLPQALQALASRATTGKSVLVADPALETA